MPEIKHTFTAGKMNKDLDERLVKNGEYRDALNIQIRTTDGSTSGEADAGTVQNLKGNEEIGSGASTTLTTATYTFGSDNFTKNIAAIADEKNDKAYFFFASPGVLTSSSAMTTKKLYIDSILEQDVDGTDSPVVIDVWGITQPATGTDGVMAADYTFPTEGANFVEFEVQDSSDYRKDMIVTALDANDDIIFTGKIENIITGIVDENEEPSPDVIQFYEPLDIPSGDAGYAASDVVAFTFLAEPVLRFSELMQKRKKKITSINIIDDLLFWTDNYSEPKKINITRCKSGCSSGAAALTTHTKLKLIKPSTGSLTTVVILEDNDDLNQDLKESHITVVRKAPRTAPTLHMSSSERGGGDACIINGYNWVPDDEGNEFNSGDFRVVSEGSNTDNEGQITNTNFREGDILKITRVGTFENQVLLSAKFITYEDSSGTPSNSSTNRMRIQMIFDSPSVLSTSMNDWLIELKKRKPLFETKFPRFGYRYKYEDGEYSSFSPWSELAFLPGSYDYKPRKGHNLGMENELRELIIKDFLPRSRELDVAAVDILYKTTDSPNVYVVKTITRGVDEEWGLFTPSNANDYALLTGELTITSEMVHRVLPSNQMLRTWDNVPRYAKAQEIVSNRLIYGNYIQGYNLPQPVGLKQSIISTYIENGINNPQKSIKSIRDYKIGMVFGDKYGRETPVLEYGYITGDSENYQSISGGISVEKELASLKNVLKISQDWNMGNSTGNEPPNWMEYVKYYIKETSSEYYNLVMDRWYFADDKFEGEGQQVWISFNSSDRNKIDEETYLILKNQHGSHEPVIEEARYKVIAIENEAPLFIKTKLVDIGELNNLQGADGMFVSDLTTVDDLTWQNPETISPLNLMLGNSLSIDTVAWDNLLGMIYDGGTSLMADDEAVSSVKGGVGKIRFRVRGQNTAFDKLYSSWRTISNYGLNGWTTTQMVIRWEEEFGDEADMLTRFNNVGYSLSGLSYHLEFKEEVIENKPEFEGKFFVKINNDELGVLDSNVLVASDETAEFIPIGEYDLAYVDSAAANPATWGNYAGEEGQMDNDWYFGAFPTAGQASMANIVSNDPEAYSDTDGSYWDNYVQPTTIPEGFATFGWMNPTEYFWYAREQNGTNLFIDAATTWKHSGFSEGTYGDGEISSNIPFSQWSDNGQTNNSQGYQIMDFPNRYKPTGLDTHDGILGNTLGRMVISHTRTSDDELFNSSPSDYKLWTELKKPGTYFKFTADPNDFVYKVIGVPGSDADYDFRGTTRNYPVLNMYGATEQCVPCSGNVNPVCKRRSIRIDFRRVYNGVEDGGSLGNFITDAEGTATNEGIDSSLFDPRGLVKHDGSQNFQIQLVKKFYQGGGQKIPINDAAIWETEPKENADLDLYYEMSNALPMRLNPTNVFDYIPLNSDVSIKRLNNTNLTYESVALTGGAHKVTNVHLSEDKSIIEVKSTQNPIWNASDASLHTTDISIGDEIEFNHSDGTITRSKVVDYYKKIAGEFYTGTTGVLTISGDSSSGSQTTYDFYESYVPAIFYQGYIRKETSSAPPFISGMRIGTVDDEGVWTQIDVPDTIETGMIIRGIGSNAGEVEPGVEVTNVYSNYFTINEDSDFPIPDDGTFSSYKQVEFIQKTGYYQIDNDVWDYPIQLSWFNCYSFGNGLESDRVRDDFNETTIDNGVKVSTTFSGYTVENKTSGLIYSGLYNSTSEMNNLNEFNMSEKITKDLNPSYGSIQRLKTRNTDVVVFTEDKVLKVLSNKDALFNADGNPQLTSSNRVLGTAVPFAGDYGISKNPESLAWDEFRMYFTDKQRGAVMRLSKDGLTPISNVGMKTYFRENLKTASDILGTYDSINGEYNLTFKESSGSNITISFNEGSKGWVSFKSFIPETGVSVSGNYLTGRSSKVYNHYSDSVVRNNFYGTQYESSIDVLFNDIPSSIKKFKTVSYEGSQAKVNQYTSQTVTDAAGNTLTNLTDNEYYNLSASTGWYIDEFTTDISKGSVPEFIDKENKWFNKINGETSTTANLDTGSFITQGIGVPSSVSGLYY